MNNSQLAKQNSNMLQALDECLMDELRARNVQTMNVPQWWIKKESVQHPVVVKCANGHMNASLVFNCDSGRFEAWEFNRNYINIVTFVEGATIGVTPKDLFDALKYYIAVNPIKFGPLGWYYMDE